MLTTTLRQSPHSILLPVLISIVMLSWVAIWLLDNSSYGWLFHNHVGGSGHLQHNQIIGLAPAVTFLLGWFLMTVAMMLPTTIPLITLFNRMIAQRSHAQLLLTLLLSGYLIAWIIFGIIALGLLWGINQILLNSISIQTWVWSAGLFMLAGTFQFSSLKYTCLDKCRSPFSFLISYWHGRNEFIDSFIIGWHHGLFCIGCCWALMILMFAVSTANLIWMMILALIMAAEKNFTWGRRLSLPLGVMLLSSGIGIGIYNLIL